MADPWLSMNTQVLPTQADCAEFKSIGFALSEPQPEDLCDGLASTGTGVGALPHLVERLYFPGLRLFLGGECLDCKNEPHTKARAAMTTAGFDRKPVEHYNLRPRRSCSTTVSKPPSAGAQFTCQQQHALRYGGGQYGWTSSP